MNPDFNYKNHPISRYNSEVAERLKFQEDNEGRVLDVDGNPKTFSNIRQLVSANARLPFTQAHIDEILKCKNDIIYFIENHVKIFDQDEGAYVYPTLRPYQKEVFESLEKHRHHIILASRGMSKSTLIRLKLVHQVCFFPNSTNVIICHQNSMAYENLREIKNYIISLEHYMKPGVITWGSTGIAFDNGSRILTASSEIDSIRGMRITNGGVAFLDEAAFFPDLDNFLSALMPTVLSSPNSKTIITSTPKGRNAFYSLYENAVLGKNMYVPHKILWSEYYDDEYAENILKSLNNDKKKFDTEYNVSFESSATTLVDTNDINKQIKKHPLETRDNNQLRIYEKPIPSHNYICVVDGARGSANGDAFAFHILDVTTKPFRQVATGEYNEIYLKMPQILFGLCSLEYENALIIGENNDPAVTSVLDLLWNNLEYTNIYQEPNKNYLGVRTTTASRPKNLSLLKWALEHNVLELHDENTLEQLYHFENINGKYQAANGYHDDLVMSLSLLFFLFDNVKYIDNFTTWIEKTNEDEQKQDEENDEFIEFLNLSYFSS